MNEWISVEDRLPPIGEEVIVAICDERYDSLCKYTSSGWLASKDIWIVDNSICPYVTHWMPLPAPPEDN